MGKASRAWAVRARAALVAKLGGQCVNCGSVLQLELDHIFKRDYVTRKLSSDQRIAHYRREAAAGLIEVRCKSCNCAKGRPVHSPPGGPLFSPDPF